MAENETKNPISSGILDQIMGSQTQSSLNEFRPAAVVTECLALLRERDRVILSQRFGLDGMEIETLESIGKKYNLTRERVRQIEKDSLAFLKKQKLPALESALQLIFDTISEHGNICSQEFLMQTMLPGSNSKPDEQAVKFLLAIGDRFTELRETATVYQSWYIMGFDLEQLNAVIEEFKKILEAASKVLSQQELYDRFKRTEFFAARAINLPDRVLKSYLNVSKLIQINP